LTQTFSPWQKFRPQKNKNTYILIAIFLCLEEVTKFGFFKEKEKQIL
jgi:hypothetical protein